LALFHEAFALGRQEFERHLDTRMTIRLRNRNAFVVGAYERLIKNKSAVSAESSAYPRGLIPWINIFDFFFSPA